MKKAFNRRAEFSSQPRLFRNQKTLFVPTPANSLGKLEIDLRRMYFVHPL